MRKFRFTQSRFNRGNSRLFPMFSLIAAFFLTFAVTDTANAQCAMTCNDDVNISLSGPDQNCEVTITPDMVLESPESCVGPYTIILTTPTGGSVPTSPMVNENYINQIQSHLAMLDCCHLSINTLKKSVYTFLVHSLEYGNHDAFSLFIQQLPISRCIDSMKMI